MPCFLDLPTCSSSNKIPTVCKFTTYFYGPNENQKEVVSYTVSP